MPEPETRQRNAQETREEARRALALCNVCDYCSGYCETFVAAERRRAFTDGDLTYLANLCHNCRACFHACQYAPPHPFAINLPKVLEQLRQQSYRELVWPRPMGGRRLGRPADGGRRASARGPDPARRRAVRPRIADRAPFMR